MKKLITKYAIFIFTIIILGCMTFEKSYENFKYTQDSNGITITSYNGSEIDLIIPEKINEVDVVHINNISSSEKQNKFIRSITIPNTVININNEALKGCQVLERIILLDDNISKTNSRNFNFNIDKNYENIKIEFPVQKENNKVSVVEKYKIREGYKKTLLGSFIGFKIEVEELKYLYFNDKEIIQLVDSYIKKQSDINIVEIDNNIILVKLSNNNILFGNGEQISKIYSEIYDIKVDSSKNVYYIGNVSNLTTRDFCRNSEVLGQNIQEYIISKDGLQYSFVKIGGVQIRGRNYLWHSSAIFLNGKEYYHSPLDRSIFINYHIFHPNGRSIVYYYIDSTNENSSLYYFNINNNTYGPYAYIDKDSCIISDDQQYLIFKQKKNSIYDKWVEEKIVLK